jgi:hypothetical protein
MKRRRGIASIFLLLILLASFTGDLASAREPSSGPEDFAHSSGEVNPNIGDDYDDGVGIGSAIAGLVSGLYASLWWLVI